MQRARGTGRLSAVWRRERTRLETLYQEGCVKIRLPNTHDASLQSVLINTAGGLTGGDDINWQAHAGPNTHLVLTTPACERIYRSTGADARVVTSLTVGENARLDWLPQETILFDGSRLNRQLDVDLDETASLLAVEAVLLGREAMGEAARNAIFLDNWRIRRNGRLIHAEATRLNADPNERDSLALLDGALALATVLYIGADAEQRHAAIADLVTNQHRAGLSLINDRLIVRALAPSGLALRRLITPILARLSGAGSLPRLWHI